MLYLDPIVTSYPDPIVTSYRAVWMSDLVERLKDGARIPRDPRNPDYQSYLTWEEDGGTLEEAIPPGPVEAPTAKERLVAAGLTVEDLQELLGL